MLDPLPLRPPPLLSALAHKISPYLGFNTLHLHIHEILLSALAYHLACAYISPIVSTRLFPHIYPQLSWKTKLNWNIHVVSLFQSTFISILALWVIFNDKERAELDFRGRVWGYTGASGLVQAFSGGYFLWDLWISVLHVDLFGIGLLAHAISAFSVYMLGYRPFVEHYAPIFILYELSSPFLNFHWFFDKVNMTGTNAQLVNGIVLMVTFFGCRLVWGSYQTVRVFSDIWAAMQYQDTAAGRAWLDGSTLASTMVKDNASAEIWKYSHGAHVPFWLGALYMTANAVLMSLNVYWFGQMIKTIRKRFDPPFGTKKPEKVEKKVLMSRGLHEDGKRTVGIDSTEVRRRPGLQGPAISDYPPPN